MATLRTLIVVLVLVSGSLPLLAATAAQQEADRAQARSDAITSLGSMNAITLEEVRETCAEGRADTVRQKQLARGNGFPEIWEWCAAAIDAAAERGLSAALFGSLVVREQGIGNQVDSEATLAAVQNGEPVRMAVAIRDAAARGSNRYIGLSGREYALRPELAYEAGHWYGRAKPEAIPLLTVTAIRDGIRRCFSVTPLSDISLDGRTLPATKACLIVGGNVGKRFAFSSEDPPNSPRP